MGNLKPKLGRSARHVLFYQGWEYYWRGTDLYRAPTSNPVMPEGKRSGRFEATAAAADAVLGRIRQETAALGDVKEIRSRIRAIRRELQEKGLRRTSWMNGGLTAEEYRLNSELFRLNGTLKQIQEIQA